MPGDAADRNEVGRVKVDGLAAERTDDSVSRQRTTETPAGHTSESASQEVLQRQVSVMKDEIDSLQIALAGETRPWWKQVSTWISIAALVVTIVIAALQIRLDNNQAKLAAEQRDLQAQQGNIAEESELSHIFEQIGATQRAQLAAERRYAATDNAVTTERKIYNTQLLAWAYKASEIIDDRADATNAAEYYMLATAYESMGPTSRVLRYLDSAMKKAEDFRTYSMAGQVLGENLYYRREIRDAERVFERLVNPPKDAPTETVTPAAALDLIVYSRSVWATRLRVLGDCAKRRTQLAEAEANVRQIANLGFTAGNAVALRNEASVPCVDTKEVAR